MNNFNELEHDLEQYQQSTLQTQRRLPVSKATTLLKYTAAASSAFVFSATADAAVIYSGVQNVGVNTPVDINGDGINDIAMSINATATSNYAYMLTPNEAAFIRHPGGNLVRKLNSGSSIGASANLVFIDGTFRAASTGGFSKGDWTTSTNTGFAGINIKDNGLDIFAWLRFSVTNNAAGLPINITLIDWAFEDTGASIIAGATTSPVPLPGSLGLLAMGVSGLAALRRRRPAKKTNDITV